MSTYLEKFKDPRWQKKRLERLNESGFSCDNCGGGGEELNVHHKFYKKGAPPWDYKNEELFVLCKKCHGDFHKAKAELDKIIGNILVVSDIDRISGYAAALSKDVFVREIPSNHHQTGYADAFRTNLSVVSSLIKDAGETVPLSPSKILRKQMV